MMQLDLALRTRMERLRQRIAARLAAGASLSSPEVVSLSQRLDQLVLKAYGPELTLSPGPGLFGPRPAPLP